MNYEIKVSTRGNKTITLRGDDGITSVELATITLQQGASLAGKLASMLASIANEA